MDREESMEGKRKQQSEATSAQLAVETTTGIYNNTDDTQHTMMYVCVYTKIKSFKKPKFKIYVFIMDIIVNSILWIVNESVFKKI